MSAFNMSVAIIYVYAFVRYSFFFLFLSLYNQYNLSYQRHIISLFTVIVIVIKLIGILRGQRQFSCDYQFVFFKTFHRTLFTFVHSSYHFFSHIATSYDSILNRRPLADLFDTGSRLKTVQVSWPRCNVSAPKISFGPGPATCAPARTLSPRLLALEIGA